MPTLEAIHVKIKKLQDQAAKIAVYEVTKALDRIRDIVEKHGLSVADIEAHLNGGRKRRVKSQLDVAGKSVESARSKGKLPPKYRDPKTGATWSGHARPPAWIANVKDRSKFLIVGAADDAGAVGKSKPASRKPTTKAVKSAKAASKKVAVKKAAGVKAAATKRAAVKTIAGKKAASRKRSAAVKKVSAKTRDAAVSKADTVAAD